jgi:hypothetical protein
MKFTTLFIILQLVSLTLRIPCIVLEDNNKPIGFATALLFQMPDTPLCCNDYQKTVGLRWQALRLEPKHTCYKFYWFTLSRKLTIDNSLSISDLVNHFYRVARWDHRHRIDVLLSKRPDRYLQ